MSLSGVACNHRIEKWLDKKGTICLTVLVFCQMTREKYCRVTLAETGKDTMTGRRVNRVEKYIARDKVMVTYGDKVADVNISQLVDFHKSHGKLATMTAVRPIYRFGFYKCLNLRKVWVWLTPQFVRQLFSRAA